MRQQPTRRNTAQIPEHTRLADQRAALAALGVVIAFPKHHVVDGLGWLVVAATLAVWLIPLSVRRYDRAALFWLSLKYRLRGSPSLPWNLSIRLRGETT